MSKMILLKNSQEEDFSIFISEQTSLIIRTNRFGEIRINYNKFEFSLSKSYTIEDLSEYINNALKSNKKTSIN